MTKKAALYARVSTENQEIEDQIERLEDWAESNDYDYDMFAEVISGKDDDREEFQSLKESVSDYDVVVVTKIDRFGRSTRHILQNIDYVEEMDSAFVTLDQPIDTREEQGMMAEVMKQILSMFADFERRMIRQRMERGFEKAKEEGRVGRPAKIDQDQLEDAVEQYEKGWSYKQVHSYLKGKYDLDVSYDTVRSNIQDFKEDN